MRPVAPHYIDVCSSSEQVTGGSVVTGRWVMWLMKLRDFMTYWPNTIISIQSAGSKRDFFQEFFTGPNLFLLLATARV